MAGEEILVITSSMIGDVILSTGAIGEILRRHGGARFTIVCSKTTAILFRRAPGEVETIPLEKKKGGGHWFDLHRRLGARRWAAVYDFRDTVFSRLLRGPRRTPRRESGLLQHKVAEASSILDGNAPLSPRLWLSPYTAERAPVGLVKAQRVLALGPGASRLGKTWPADRFGELAARLTAKGGPLADAMVVVTGGPGDRAAVEAIGTAVPRKRMLDMTGADLLVTAVAMARADLFVGNDSGMMHLSAAAGAPTLGLFGPTDERLYGPWGDHAAAIRPPDIAFTFGKISKTVSKDECQMTALTVDQVETAAKGLLDTAR